MSFMERKDTKKKTNKRPRAEKQVLECFYCKTKEVPDYKDVLKLRRFISDRGKLIAKNRTGLCSSCQRKVANEIKKARFLALLPYTERHAL